jgi:hypothetical protein
MSYSKTYSYIQFISQSNEEQTLSNSYKTTYYHCQNSQYFTDNKKNIQSISHGHTERVDINNYY